MKYIKKQPGTIKLQGDFVYPVETLRKHFEVFKNKLHKYDMKFYSGENRLRSMGDSLCCCGIDGLGWKPNTVNLNHLIYDKEAYAPTGKMKEVGTAKCFCAINQDSANAQFYKNSSFEDIMGHMMSKGFYKCLIPED